MADEQYNMYNIQFLNTLFILVIHSNISCNFLNVFSLLGDFKFAVTEDFM